ncbi:MAG: HPr family phosphocarrier protein [Oscillospiraceae bacterium]|nr:HPr family phosphocarrier protein [Oscillospiraceae bacterium]
MKEFTFTVKDQLGIHARPAGLLVKEIKKYQSAVTIERDGQKIDGRRLIALMGMAVKCGQTITVAVDGPDEEEAAVGLESFLTANL